MEDLTILLVMTLLQSEDDLKENLPHYVLSYVVLLCLALLHQLSHVPILTVLHDYEDLLLLLFNNPTPHFVIHLLNLAPQNATPYSF